MSKIRGQVKNPGYPQAEGLLGECMAKYGRDLGEDTNFGKMCVFVISESVSTLLARFAHTNNSVSDIFLSVYRVQTSEFKLKQYALVSM